MMDLTKRASTGVSFAIYIN